MKRVTYNEIKGDRGEEKFVFSSYLFQNEKKKKKNVTKLKAKTFQPATYRMSTIQKYQLSEHLLARPFLAADLINEKKKSEVRKAWNVDIK